MILIFIFAINAILLLFVRSEKRFWLVSISLWTLLISSFIFWRIFHDKKINQIEIAYWKSADENAKHNPDNWRGDESLFEELESSKAYLQKNNITFLNVVFLQTILTFISQIIGYERTEHRYIYKWTSIIFGILTLLCIFLKLFIVFVPIGGMVG